MPPGVVTDGVHVHHRGEWIVVRAHRVDRIFGRDSLPRVQHLVDGKDRTASLPHARQLEQYREFTQAVQVMGGDDARHAGQDARR